MAQRVAEELTEKEPLVGFVMVTSLVLMVMAILYTSMDHSRAKLASLRSEEQNFSFDPSYIEHWNWLRDRDEEKDKKALRDEMRVREVRSVMAAQKQFVAQKQKLRGVAIRRHRQEAIRAQQSQQAHTIAMKHAATEVEADREFRELDDDADRHMDMLWKKGI